MANKLGQLEEDPALIGRRDAFHVACVLVTCRRKVSPGGSVRFVDESCREVEWALIGDGDTDAIVDPFVEDEIPAGVGFWVVLVPDRTSNLTHHFDIDTSHARARSSARMVEEFKEVVDGDGDGEEEDDDDACSGCN